MIYIDFLPKSPLADIKPENICKPLYMKCLDVKEAITNNLPSLFSKKPYTDLPIPRTTVHGGNATARYHTSDTPSDLEILTDPEAFGCTPTHINFIYKEDDDKSQSPTILDKIQRILTGESAPYERPSEGNRYITDEDL